MIIYRSFFHRLHHFPGPRLAKVSKLFHFLVNLKLDSYRRLERWHQQYGNVVRIGKWDRHDVFRFSFLFCFLGRVRLVFLNVRLIWGFILVWFGLVWFRFRLVLIRG